MQALAVQHIYIYSNKDRGKDYIYSPDLFLLAVCTTNTKMNMLITINNITWILYLLFPNFPATVSIAEAVKLLFTVAISIVMTITSIYLIVNNCGLIHSHKIMAKHCLKL